VIAAAKTEADKNSWPVVTIFVDGPGHTGALQRIDNTQIGSIEVATQKAKTAALFRRPTKVFEDILAAGGSGLRLHIIGFGPLDATESRGGFKQDFRVSHMCMQSQTLGRSGYYDTGRVEGRYCRL